MSWSLGEIAALSTKAARGAGYSWGIAEEAGWAVKWACRQGLPGPEALSSLLSDTNGQSALSLGVALSDGAGFEALATDASVSAPLLVLPFLSRIASGRYCVQVQIDRQIIHVGAYGTDLITTLPAKAELALRWVEMPLAPRKPAQRVSRVSDRAMATLEGFAARTYAPVTEESRRSGAGAGLRDND